jgi:hypothetical protein
MTSTNAALTDLETVVNEMGDDKLTEVYTVFKNALLGQILTAISNLNSNVQTGGTTGKKKKRVRPEGEPKRPNTSYIEFTRDPKHRARAVARCEEELETHSQKDVMCMLGALWKEATEKEKAPYVKQAAKDKEEYKVKMDAFKATLVDGTASTDEPVAVVVAAPAAATPAKKKASVKKTGTSKPAPRGKKGAKPTAASDDDEELTQS